MITLIPGSTLLSRPAQYRRSQDFSIISNIVLDCSTSLSIVTQWTIGNCSSDCLTPIQSNSSIITTTSELFIPARALNYGLYELKLTVTMTDASILRASASAFVNIIETGITANLVPFGASVVTSGRDDDLKLDPDSYSVDPDQLTFNENVRSTKHTFLFHSNMESFIDSRNGIILIFVDHMILMIRLVWSYCNRLMIIIIVVS
jgi:hypothetical protein